MKTPAINLNAGPIAADIRNSPIIIQTEGQPREAAHHSPSPKVLGTDNPQPISQQAGRWTRGVTPRAPPPHRTTVTARHQARALPPPTAPPPTAPPEHPEGPPPPTPMPASKTGQGETRTIRRFE